MYFFLAAIFLEIAIYGSVILNEVMKYNEKKAEKNDEKQDEQITGDSDKNKGMRRAEYFRAPCFSGWQGDSLSNFQARPVAFCRVLKSRIKSVFLRPTNRA